MVKRALSTSATTSRHSISKDDISEPKRKRRRMTGRSEANTSRRMSSQMSEFEDESNLSGSGSQEEPTTPLTYGNTANPVVDYESNNPNILSYQVKNLLTVHAGWTIDQLALAINVSNQMKECSLKWDDDKFRSAEFCRKIDEVMDPYKWLYNRKVIQRQQPPITAFFTPVIKDPVDEEESIVSIKKEEL